MDFPRRDDGHVRRVTDATDPVMYRAKHGQLKLRLVTALDRDGQRRPKLRIHVGAEKALRCR
jgi:hypothetical protein